MKKKDKQMVFKIIEDLSNQYPVLQLCELAGVSKGGYYKWLKRKDIISPKQQEDEYIKGLIIECYNEVNGIYGYYRIKIWLFRKYGIRANHKRVYRLMKELGIKAKIRQKKGNYKKGSENIVVPNILNRDFNATELNQKWTTDITYLMFNQKRLYLSVIKDLYNNEIVAYKISKSNDLKLVSDTVKEAIKKQDAKGVTLHSDQGFQYTSRQYHKLLKKHEIIPSMSRKGNCLDNASMENFFGHLKSEVMYLHSFKSEEEVIAEINRYIYFYNYNRYQKKLSNLSPVEYRMTKIA
ncbi:IS3 family transposase [Neobacillus niacini]|uniref:IS3 family transposase n=1 Tax=Neobacillus niacini TaxID=86668 RepID=UPI0028555AC1|nr:IS3 family transposase [Neobacillus niacini]MDR7003112.1 transposase InsO family protein [Neobacillus niacini]